MDLIEFKHAFKAASDANSLPGADNLGKKAAALVNNNGEIATKEEMTRLKDEGYLKEKDNGMLVPTDKGDKLLEAMQRNPHGRDSISDYIDPEAKKSSLTDEHLQNLEDTNGYTIFDPSSINKNDKLAL